MHGNPVVWVDEASGCMMQAACKAGTNDTCHKSLKLKQEA